MDHLDLFTDGGAIKIGNDYYGSSAYVIRFKNRYFTKSVPVSIGTNNHFELLCIRDGLRTILNGWSRMENIELRIVSDSQYSISCVTDYFDGWVKRNGKYYNKSGKEVANIDLILDIRDMLTRIPHYRFIKIKSHIDASDLEKSYLEFKKKNKMDLSFTDYLIMVKFNETCDTKIKKLFNLKRRELANENGKEFI